MLPDEMEAEKNRKIIVALSNKIQMLETNINQLQDQLQKAFIRIKELNDK